MPDKILIVEDTRSLSKMLATLLESTHNFESDIAQNYAEAEALLDSADRYFVAIVDLNLPDAPDGEAADLVLAKGIPTVVFTSKREENVKEGFWLKGAADYINKHSAHSMEYVTWLAHRIYNNANVKVLVVDDSASESGFIESTLQLQRYDTLSASSSEEALSILKAHPDIRVCIVDFVTKEMSGTAFSSAVRQTRSREELKIIGVSADSGKNVSAQFIKAGANDFLRKPFTREELLCRVNHSTELQETYIKMKELNEAKNRVLGMAAHDIRSPVANAKTASELLLRRKLPDERSQTLVTMIRSSVCDALELLESILDISAIEEGHVNLTKQQVSYSQLIEERVAVFANQAEEKSIVLSAKVEPNISALIDPVKIKQVIDNLISNAIKYCPEHAKVDILMSAEGDQSHLEVCDTGPGIPADECKQLFKAYAAISTTATAGEKKTGLGLAIAKNIVDAHSGKIFYREHTEGGACFCVNLPLEAP